MTVGANVRVPPSLLARKILCFAYLPAKFDETQRFKFQALHAMAVLRVIARHLKMGYQLEGVERVRNGHRSDLSFKIISSTRKRLVEVKSSKHIRDLHRIQAALYSSDLTDEVVVSNRETDEVLTPEFILEVWHRAEITRQFLATNPVAAAITFSPNDDCCYTCGNKTCPSLAQAETNPRSPPPRGK